MVWVYFDASALVKRYSSEEGTELVNELFQRLPVEQMTCAVILRSCLNLHQVLQDQEQRLVLWSCDKRLLRAAQDEGVDVFDPEVGTKAQLQILLSRSTA